MDQVPLVNGLKLINKTENEPPDLIWFKNISGYNTYSSEYNPSLYIVFDHSENLYYVLEDVDSDDIEKSLGSLLKDF